MSSFGPESIHDVVNTCQANLDEIGSALGRALGDKCSLSIGPAATFDPATHLAGLEGPGLALVMRIGGSALVALLSEATGVLPAWYRNPGPTGTSQLATLAQELSMLVVPDGVEVENSGFAQFESVAQTILAAGPHASAARVPLLMRLGDHQATLHLVWPLLAPEKLQAQPLSAPAPTAPVSPESRDGEPLPAYVRSLLRVSMPVSVALASRKKSIEEILELGIGSIIHFDKPCDDPLELEVNGHAIAQGEAVKVGDKFGLRVQSVLLPNERFRPLKPSAKSGP
jgi:flagellar motor switch protein FliN